MLEPRPAPLLLVAPNPVYTSLFAAAFAAFTGALVTDVVYWRSAQITWSNFSIWLITGGLVLGGLALLAGFVGLLRRRAMRAPMLTWAGWLGLVLAWALGLVNAFVHSRDGYTAVVPTGLMLSSLVVILCVLSGVSRPATAGVIVTDTGRQLHRRTPWAAFASACLVFLGGITAVLGLSGTDHTFADPSNQIGANPVLPGQHEYLLPPMDIAPVRKWAQGETPKVPAGLKIEALATGLLHPRFVYALPNNDILIVETNGPPAPLSRPKDVIMGLVQGFAGTHAPGGNRITLVRAANGTTPATRTVFLDHLTSPFGVALVGHDLYVANTDSIMRFPYTDGETTITTPGTKLIDLPGGPIDHHWTKSLLASADGTKLYVGVGSNSNITENGFPAELNRAAVWEVDRATGAMRLFATGLRNPTGLGWEPQSGKLWAVANERDELGPNLVPDYLTSVQDGAFYGWPYSYYGQHIDPRVMPQKPDLVARAIAPDYALSSHVAPLGLAFYSGTSLPETYRGGAFVGEHGSWDRTPLNGYKVVYVPFSGGKPNGHPLDVVTGFLTPDGHAQGRPVGLAVDQTGALLVADDLGDTVWRVSAAATAAPAPATN